MNTSPIKQKSKFTLFHNSTNKNLNCVGDRRITKCLFSVPSSLWNNDKTLSVILELKFQQLIDNCVVGNRQKLFTDKELLDDKSLSPIAELNEILCSLDTKVKTKLDTYTWLYT